MRFNNLDLNLLVALDALLAEQSITKAARKLNLSQSATSGVLARLREYFGDELLVQVGRTMVRTTLGDQLVNPVRNVLLEIQSTIETRQVFKPEHSSRHFRIVASDYSTCVVLSQLVRQLSISAPGVSVEIISPKETTIIQVERGEIDVVLMPKTVSGLEEHSGELLFRDTYSCVAWKKNTVVRDSISLTQYQCMDHVAVHIGNASSFEELAVCKTSVTRRIVTTVDQFSTLPQLLIGTDRIATIQTRLAILAAKSLPLRILPPPLEIPELEMMMRWHRVLDGNRSHQWLREQMKVAAAT